MPYDSNNDLDLTNRVLNEPPPRVADRVAVPTELYRLVSRCLARTPAERPPGVAEVQAELDALLAVTPWTEAGAARCWACCVFSSAGG